MSNEIIIDAENSVLGRISSYAAKQSLLGKKVIIVNCDKSILSGRRKNIIEEYHTLKIKGGTAMKGPYFSRSIEKIVKRTIRGMLSNHKGRGIDALKRITCYTDIPEKYSKMSKIKLFNEEKLKSITLTELSKNI